MVLEKKNLLIVQELNKLYIELIVFNNVQPKNSNHLRSQ